MHIAIKEIDDGLYRMRWTAEPGEAERGQTFQLNRLHPSLCYVITCHRDPSPPPPPPLRPRRSTCGARSARYHPPVYPLSARLKVVRAESSEPLPAKRRKTEHSANESTATVDHLEYGLDSVWIHSSNGKRLYFERSAPESGAWELHSARIDFDREWDAGASRWLVAIKFWMKFEKLTGPRNELKQLADLLTSQEACDVAFRLANDEQIGSHVAILSARSQVFAKMLKSGTENSEVGKISINETAPDVFKQLLRYVYSSEMPKPMSGDLAKSLHLAATRYDVEDLRKECCSFIVSDLNVENAISTLTWSDKYAIHDIKEACFSYINRQAKEISLSDEYEGLLKQSPELFLTMTRKMMENLPSGSEVSSEEDEYSISDDSGSESDTEESSNSEEDLID